MTYAMMDTMQPDAKFWDALARKYAAQPVSDPDAWDRTLDRTRHYLRAEDKVLEVGGGTGSSALRLAGACGHLTSTDFAPEMIAIAREKAGDTANVTFEVADMELDGYAEESFDAVLAFNLLHLLPTLERDLRRLAAVTKPGGVFVSKTVCLGGSLVLRPLIKVLQWVGKAPHVRFLKPAELDAMIEAAGFEIVETGEYNKGTRGHFVVARKRG